MGIAGGGVDGQAEKTNTGLIVHGFNSEARFHRDLTVFLDAPSSCGEACRLTAGAHLCKWYPQTIKALPDLMQITDGLDPFGITN